MKNQSTSSTKGKAWPHPVSGGKEGYNQVGGGQSGHGTPGTKFIGKTKGNGDFKPERSSGVSTGHGGGPHKAGG